MPWKCCARRRPCLRYPFLIFRRDVTALRVSKNGEIAAGDIEADTGKRNLVFMSDNSTDRLRVTFVAVRAKNSALATGIDTILDLPQRRFIVPAEYFRFCEQRFPSDFRVLCHFSALFSFWFSRDIRAPFRVDDFFQQILRADQFHCGSGTSPAAESPIKRPRVGHDLVPWK